MPISFKKLNIQSNEKPPQNISFTQQETKEPQEKEENKISLIINTLFFFLLNYLLITVLFVLLNKNSQFFIENLTLCFLIATISTLLRFRKHKKEGQFSKEPFYINRTISIPILYPLYALLCHENPPVSAFFAMLAIIASTIGKTTPQRIITSLPIVGLILNTNGKESINPAILYIATTGILFLILTEKDTFEKIRTQLKDQRYINISYKIENALKNDLWLPLMALSFSGILLAFIY